MYTVEKKKVSRSGKASLGWQMGYGFYSEYLTVKSDQWCVLRNGRVIAECRGKKNALLIQEKLSV